MKDKKKISKQDEICILVDKTKEDLEKLDEKINNIGSENIVNHSNIAEAEVMVREIEDNIKKANNKNRMISCIRNIKIFGTILQGAYPYLIVAGLLFGAQSLIGDVPYIRQREFKVAQHEQIIDKNGIFDEKITYITQSDDLKNEAYYSTRWVQKEDGNYYRVRKTYDIGVHTPEDLKNIISKPDFNFEEEFGKSTSNKYEYKTPEQITEKDLEEGDGFKIIYRYNDDEDVILGIQDLWPNIGLSAAHILFVIICSLFVFMIRDDVSDFDFDSYLDYVKRENKNVNIEEVKKLFAQKKIKFEVVKHEQVTLTDPVTGEQTKIRKAK